MDSCICPVVSIKVSRFEMISEAQMRSVADTLCATVVVSMDSSELGPTVYGKHREDCPCHPTELLEV